MTQDDLNRVLMIQSNVNAVDAAALQALVDAALKPDVEPDLPGLYAIVDPRTNKVVEYIRGASKADILDKNREYAAYTLMWIEA